MDRFYKNLSVEFSPHHVLSSPCLRVFFLLWFFYLRSTMKLLCSEHLRDDTKLSVIQKCSLKIGASLCLIPSSIHYS